MIYHDLRTLIDEYLPRIVEVWDQDEDPFNDHDPKGSLMKSMEADLRRHFGQIGERRERVLALCRDYIQQTSSGQLAQHLVGEIDKANRD